MHACVTKVFQKHAALNFKFVYGKYLLKASKAESRLYGTDNI